MICKFDLDRVIKLMNRRDIDVLLASSPPNVYYLSDVPYMHTAPNRLLFTVQRDSPVYCLFPEDGDPKLVLTNSAFELANRASWIDDIRTYKTGTYIVRPKGNSIENEKSATEMLIETLKEVKPKRLALEKQSLNTQLYEKITKSLGGVKLLDAAGIFKELRMIKTEEEIRRFKEATRICCSAIMKVIKSIDKGATEIALQNILKRSILNEGGDSWHQTTIAIGPENGPNIYNQPSSKVVAKGDVIRIDVGCVYKGYTSDNARTVVFQHASKEAKRTYTAIKEATEKGVEAMKPGVKACEIHKMIIDIVRKKLDRNYTRGNVGHGVGIELYDDPEVTIDNMQELMPGMTISLEAPYHKFGLGGLILEDSILIDKDGHEVVTDMSRELFII